MNFCTFLCITVNCVCFSDKITEMYKKVQKCTEIYRDVQRSTKIYKDVQKSTKLYNSKNNPKSLKSIVNTYILIKNSIIKHEFKKDTKIFIFLNTFLCIFFFCKSFFLYTKQELIKPNCFSCSLKIYSLPTTSKIHLNKIFELIFKAFSQFNYSIANSKK